MKKKSTCNDRNGPELLQVCAQCTSCFPVLSYRRELLLLYYVTLRDVPTGGSDRQKVPITPCRLYHGQCRQPMSGCTRKGVITYY